MAQIDTYRSGEAVSLSFSFNILDIQSATYTVKDSEGSILISDEPIEITEGQMSIPVVVSADHNQLSEKERDLRHVIVKATASGLTHEERKMYVLLNNFELLIPGQSFATVADAQMQAIDMLNGDTLLADGEGLMRKRLIEATRRVKTLPFSIRKILRIDFDRYERPQNMLNVYDIPWGVDGVYRHDLVDWERMTQDKFDELPDYFKEALMLAVVNEACEIANGNDVAAAREDGILSESIGETTNMYRTGKAANVRVARSTWRLLTSYINNRMIVRRA
ncbi:hypothetical protein ABT929_004188 [Salmonella enterica subsp. enterica serovar Uganda]|uniref:Uncharacterized protein n=4 Tax=Salmonella enterica TaxID=28901 RepID=A0A747XRS4_SALER|nr:hypothetical protein [Salmonella enterica]EAA5695449.1 hypothetical protein [Salmonella enterica subsp. enterica serovar Oranienburg]EAC1010514.1 hypothetical protein [Salmonella enterica subsp. enterica serovar Jangwani]EBH8226464.1 hypothetical protein [Salmonella enterica subsp. enterica serovar Typhimurium str. UK-1]EBH8754261.1 hypothetical protein [Salmonella enterica subsp. houtenae serovar 44:z4,z23:-]EBU7586306.1 hypothetical protein [Salmonella enterica subsp. enterica serovar Mon